MQGYTDTILKYAADNSRAGLLEQADGTGEVGLGAQEAGTRLAVRFALKLEREKVTTVRFQVFGCGFTIAACAAAAELAEGQLLEELPELTPELIDRKLGGLPRDRDYCATLAHQALQAAVQSACNGATTVQAAHAEEQHGPRLDPADPLFVALLASPAPLGIDPLDRELFAGLLALAAQEEAPLPSTIGLEAEQLDLLLDCYFPAADAMLLPESSAKSAASPEINPEVLQILLSHVPCDATGGRNQSAEWLARSLAARAAHPGHLWCAMGLLERPQLTAAIRRHLPTLAAANAKGMRWKRYLFKQVCEQNGGLLCKSPNCGDCSDYSLCFASDDKG